MSAFRTFTFLPTLALALAGCAAAEGVWTTPHDSYSSSVGVLGCKINTDRVAYWPGSVDCDKICVKLSYQGRSVHLLRIDQSGGAYDISYDAWNYLQTGKSAAIDPIAGGTVAMDYEEVDASECADLIYTEGSKLPLSASNSINYLSSCLAQPNSYVAQNYVLYNICDAICSLGQDEECQLDLAVSNQPSCPHTLGLTTTLTTAPVYNIQYQSGDVVVAGTGEVADPQIKTPSEVAPGPKDTVQKPPASPKVQPSPSAGIFKEQPAAETYAPSPPTTPPSPPAGTAAPAETWTTQVTSSAAAVPTWSVSAPAPNYNASSPSFGKPSGGSPTVLDEATASVTRVPPTSSVVAVSGGSEQARMPLFALFAGSIACSILLAL
ncbi:hypothetical protein B0T16DRAFT_411034 [Cercophora newfieldiana]|uniref:Uncharacterized protein n=1 Tax=Cercophora newfieldiana TaxID=92897 RepID=A0AA39YFC9_9PEZI|nr:hypothetical protein B0T16DRAFT_411034 [Cercophora newfieldiana]